jgi:hypothetical protein
MKLETGCNRFIVGPIGGFCEHGNGLIFLSCPLCKGQLLDRNIEL